MDKQPVKPGTVVQLPRRADQASVKKAPAKKKAATAEEQLAVLRAASRRLRLLMLLLLLALCLCAGALAFKMLSPSTPEAPAATSSTPVASETFRYIP